MAGSIAPLLGSLFLASWVSASFQENNPSPRHLSALMGRPREHVEIIGVVADDPVLLRHEDRGRGTRHFTLRVTALRRAGAWQRASGDVAVSWVEWQNKVSVEYGQEWRLRGILSRDSLRRSSLWAGPAHRFRVDEGDELLLAEGKGNPFIRHCLAARRFLARRLEMGVSSYPDSHGMVKAMLLGYRSDVSGTLRRAFSVTGMLHVLAVSGLHVGILALLFVAILKAIGVPFHRHALYLVPVLFVYAVLTGLRASAVRASLMAGILVLGPVFGRRSNITTAVALAASLILIASPGQLADPGFIFSFVAVIGLMIIQPRIMHRWKVTEFLSEPWVIQRPTSAQKVLRWIILAACGTAATSIAVWLVTAPLTARWFNLCSPIALVGNLLVIPMAFVVIFTGVLAVVLGALHPVVAELFNHANHVFVQLLLGWVGILAKIPAGHFYVGYIPGTWFAIWYLFLFLLVTARAYLRKLLVPIAGVCVAAAWVGWWGGYGNAQVVLLEESDSSAVLVDGPGSVNILVNAGPAYRANELVRALQRRGINRLEALVLAHADSAHSGGALAVLNAFSVREVWCSPWAEQSPVCRAVLDEANARGVKVRRLAAGDHGMFGDLEWEVLHPARESRARRSAEGAIVMRFARNGGAVLLMNGADASVEENILNRAVDPSAEIIITGGRRMANTCSTDWITAVRPRAALVGTGAGSRWVEPDRDVFARLQSWGVEVLRTDQSGTMEIKLERRPEYPGGPWCRVDISR